MHADTEVLVVGAGPTGLVLALCLHTLGIRTRIVDKAAQAGTTSRALGVHARTLEFYRQLGLADEVVASGLKTMGLNLWVGGSRAARVPIGTMGLGQSFFPFVLMYPQDEHEKLLIARLAKEGVRVERSTELTGFEQAGGRVQARLRRADGSEETAGAAFLAGCDGASSSVRRIVGADFAGGTYSHIFYVADVEASGPATNEEVHIDMEDTDFLGVFPLTRKGHVRVIGSVRDDLAGRRSELTFDDVRGTALRNMKLTVSGENWFSTYRVHHRVAQAFRWDRAFLLGDAAHVHSPVGAQGMNTGIGDAMNLSWKLAAVLRSRAPESLLDTYQAERIAFARRLVSTTDRAFSLVTNRSALAGAVRRRAIPFIMPRAVSIARVRKAMFRTLSQIGISYRRSALSEGSAGTARAGDRLPWHKGPDGRDNFASLAGLAWRLHAYGAAAPGLEAACRELGLEYHGVHWHPSMGAAGLAEDGVYLLRPDGYIAWARVRGTPEQLRAYLTSRQLAPGGSPRAGGPRR